MGNTNTEIEIDCAASNLHKTTAKKRRLTLTRKQGFSLFQ